MHAECRSSSVQPKLVRSMQICPITGEYRVLEHRDDAPPELGLEVGKRVQLASSCQTEKYE